MKKNNKLIVFGISTILLVVVAVVGLNINEKRVKLMLSETSGNLYVGGNSKSITINGKGHRTLSCESSTANVTCSIENTILTISPISVGTGTITVREGNKNKTVTYEATVSYPTIKEKVISVERPISDANIDFSFNSAGIACIYNNSTDFCDYKTDTSQVTKGLYYTADAEVYGEDGERIYYYRGDTDNNWVSFGGYYWRIVRTTAEGGAKLVYSGGNTTTGPSSLTATSGITATNTAFNKSYDLKYYVGYTYNTSSYTGVQTNSNAKTIIDDWYTASTLTETDKTYLSETAVYCGDRSTERIDGSDIYYPAYDRLYTNKRPTFACNKANGSRYTVTVNSTNGNNGYLTYPIAMLSADELSYAGLIVNNTIDNKSLSYIMKNAAYDWWTMSPVNWNNASSSEFRVYSKENFGESFVNFESYGLRPSVSLKSCITVIGGNGSKETPYTLSNSQC